MSARKPARIPIVPVARQPTDSYTSDIADPPVGSQLLIEGGTDALLIEGGTDALLLEA